MPAKTTAPNQSHSTKHKQSVTQKSSTTEPAARQAQLPRTVAASQLAQSADVLTLQRTVGNRALSRLIQAKLTVGAAGDGYEREADRVAQQVMATPAPVRTPAAQHPSKKAAELQTKPLATSITPLVQRASGGGAFEVSGGFERQLSASRGGGRPLPDRVRAFMEPRFGADFSGVRLHTGGQSAQLNRSVQAQAFTQGSDIYLGEGQGDVQSDRGQHLLAHELTHVVQQTGSQPAVQRKPSKKKTAPDPVNKQFQETGQAPQNSNVYLVLKLALKTGTKTRGNFKLGDLMAGGSGHSWIELSPGPDFGSLDDLSGTTQGERIVNAMADSTQHQISTQGSSTLGFYPAVANVNRPQAILKQFFTDLPGHIREPEQDHFAGQQRAEKSIAITDPDKALRLLNVVAAHRTRSYNLLRHNCTDFVIDAAKSVGFSPGVTSESGVTIPALLYKQIYKMAELGDQSAKYTELSPKENKQHKIIDAKHVKSSTDKRLKKAKLKQGIPTVELPKKKKDIKAWQAAAAAQQVADKAAADAARVKSVHKINGFLHLATKGFLRNGEEIAVTGQINGTQCEILQKAGGKFNFDTPLYVEADEFNRVMNFPYPGTEKLFQQSEPENEAQAMDQAPDEQPAEAQGGVEHSVTDQLANNLVQDEEVTEQPATGPEPALEPEPEGKPLAKNDVFDLVAPLKATDTHGGSQFVLAAGLKILITEIVSDNQIKIEGSNQTRGYVTLNDLAAAIGG